MFIKFKEPYNEALHYEIQKFLITEIPTHLTDFRLKKKTKYENYCLQKTESTDSLCTLKLTPSKGLAMILKSASVLNVNKNHEINLFFPSVNTPAQLIKKTHKWMMPNWKFLFQNVFGERYWYFVLLRNMNVFYEFKICLQLNNSYMYRVFFIQNSRYVSAQKL